MILCARFFSPDDLEFLNSQDKFILAQHTYLPILFKDFVQCANKFYWTTRSELSVTPFRAYFNIMSSIGHQSIKEQLFVLIIMFLTLINYLFKQSIIEQIMIWQLIKVNLSCRLIISVFKSKSRYHISIVYSHVKDCRWSFQSKFLVDYIKEIVEINRLMFIVKLFYRPRFFILSIFV